MAKLTLRDKLVQANENERLSRSWIEELAEWVEELKDRHEKLSELVEAMGDRAVNGEALVDALNDWAEADDRESKADAKEAALEALNEFVESMTSVDAAEIEADEHLREILAENAAAEAAMA